jgi:RNA polymerase sigma factor (sigma-70 family)
VALVERESGAAGVVDGQDPLLALLPRAASGDAVAVRAVVGALSPEVVRVARAVVGANDGELDDVVQEALLGLVHALPGFRGECSLRGFANRIAVRAALRARRRAKLRAAQSALLTAGASELHGRPSPPPDDQHLAARRLALLHALLDALPEAQAETLALRVVLGFSLQETADATGVPVNTVRSRVRLAREALRARIESEPALLELLVGAP